MSPQLFQAYTLYQSVRPFGVSAIIAGCDPGGEAAVDGEVGEGPKVGAGGRTVKPSLGKPGLYMIEPSGMYWGYYGAAAGKGRQAAKAELEKLELQNGEMTLLKAVKEAARIVYAANDENKDKDFELEMSWISDADGPTEGRHEEVPKELREEAIKLAKKALQDEEDSDDDKMAE
jgi:20S proteasome subunit alpha 7